jgi:hypothetical protein
VVVIGTGRSGTSALAAMLQSYGVDMGPDPISADHANPNGYFEDGPLVALDAALLATNPGPVDRYLRNYLCRRANDSELWGVKDPRLCQTWTTVKKFLPCPYTVVHVHRPIEECVASCVRAYGGDEQQWRELMETRDDLARSISDDEDAVSVSYPELLERPADCLRRIAERLPERCEPLYRAARCVRRPQSASPQRSAEPERVQLDTAEVA